MNKDLIRYGIGTAFVAVVAASAIFWMSQISTATQSIAETTAPAEAAPIAERTVRVILPSPYSL